MSERHVVLMRFDPKRWAEAGELAQANYPDGRNKLGGNVTQLIEHLIFQAYNDPEKFGLAMPGEEKSAQQEISVNEELGRNL